MKRPALQNKRVGVLGTAFRPRNVFGTFEERATGSWNLSGFFGLDLNAECRVHDTLVMRCFIFLQECDCVLPNTMYGNSSVCNETSGSCTCKPKIGGRQCDRCHENAYNTSRGCVGKLLSESFPTVLICRNFFSTVLIETYGKINFPCNMNATPCSLFVFTKMNAGC